MVEVVEVDEVFAEMRILGCADNFEGCRAPAGCRALLQNVEDEAEDAE